MSLLLASLLLAAQAEGEVPPFWPIPHRPSREDYQRRATLEPGRLADELERARAWENHWVPMIEIVVEGLSADPAERSEKALEEINSYMRERAGLPTPRSMAADAQRQRDERERAELSRLRQRQQSRDDAQARSQRNEHSPPADDSGAAAGSPRRESPLTSPGDGRADSRDSRGRATSRPTDSTGSATGPSDRERADRERTDRERAERAERDRQERERLEKERIESERERLHAEGLTREQAERERRQREQAERERREREEAERRRREEQERRKKEQEDGQGNVPIRQGRPVNPYEDGPDGPPPAEPELDPCAFAICMEEGPAPATPPEPRTPRCWEAICLSDDGDTVVLPEQPLDRCAYAICTQDEDPLTLTPQPKPPIDITTIRRGGEVGSPRTTRGGRRGQGPRL